MRTVKTLDKLRAFVLWTYAVAVLTGIAYAALTGQETAEPAEVIHAKSHAR